MLVIPAILGYFLGQLACVGALLASALVTGMHKHPIALLPLTIAGLWIAGTVDFRDLSDGPMRIDADVNLIGIGGGIPPALSNGSDGPVWWIAAGAGAALLLLSFWPKIPNLRFTALLGLASLAITYASLAALDAMY